MKYFYSIILLFLMSYSLNASTIYKNATIDEHRSCQKRLGVEGGDIAYIDVGEGEPILLIHGLPTSSWLYRHMIADLLGRGYRVVAPDLLGYGASDKPQNYDLYQPEKQADRILTLMDHLGISAWTHVMHDAGGLWSWEMMMKAPERVSRLVVLNTIAYEEGFKPPVRFKRGGWFGKLIVGTYDRKMLGKMMINSTLGSGTHKHKFSKEDKRGYWFSPQKGRNEAIYQFFTSFPDMEKRLKDYHKMFETLNVPTQIIWGAKDKFLLADVQVPKLQKALNVKDEDVHILEDAKHFIQEEKPKEIVEIICSGR